ncbi:ATP-dependent DNA ligase [Nocardia takedensis]|uniref:ATP-dependent DNA ligase n=1 Tax=Nocardia takedensis TaxID=259390 RepID=UPI003F767185
MLPVPAPMLAVPGDPPRSAQWSCEIKFDGARALTRCDGRGVRLFSRTRRDFSAAFPELIEAMIDLVRGREFIFDGEVIAPAPATGAPVFSRLGRRLHMGRPSAALRRTVPVQLVLFDLLAAGEENLMPLPYIERRGRLEQIGLTGPLVLTPPAWPATESERLLEVVRQHRLEGVVSKKNSSAYLAGRRARSWVKSPLRAGVDVVVGGWLPGTDDRTFGSLLVGGHREDRLVYLGAVGTGFSASARRDLQIRLDRLAVGRSPFATELPTSAARDARFVRPCLIGQVEYREITAGGLRHPSWKGLRSDIDAAQVQAPT